MAGKRCATSELNHDNWDREEVPEEAGTFQKASDDSLKQRVIKTARRRNPISSVRVNDDNEKKSAFTSFTGFGKSSTPTSADFSFLSKINTPNTPPKQNGIEEKVENDKNDISSLKFNNNHSMDKSNDYFSKLKGLNQSVSNWIKKHVDTNPLINLQPIFRDYEKYFEELEKEKILKPPDVNNADSIVFKPTTSVPDSTTEKKQSDTAVTTKVSKESSSITSKPPSTAGSFSFGTTTKESLKTTPSFSFGTNTSSSTKISETSTVEATKSSNTTIPSFIFGAQPAKSTPFTFSSNTTSPSAKNTTNSTVSQITFGVPTNKDAPKPTFTFGNVSNKETTQATSTTTPSFSFGSLPSNSSISQFSTSSPFTFGNVVKPVTSGGDNKEEVGGGEEEESETPPSNEFTPVVEKDHVYTVRCKVFVKKDDKFGDRGVGSLYLKPIADTEKIQLVVRADTNLGNVLLNFILSENIPMKRLGKKDVMLVCVPTPEVKPPPVPVLIRVKSSEEADKLLETLEKYKK
ncbi:nuclear pore complex protein Nup50 isoform X1 [Diorhabda carinulata]|uniref:nuclear pore complex protein Nup50 isoform X1 n=1 Tax=Diorhabda carinulata TaxID=1163345 RepID=UPI0025A26C8A|nr:nuclear pore complex protein Nup50 isoform X1 [Diorhabda carinulata]